MTRKTLDTQEVEAETKEFFFERMTRWIGSVSSLVFHTVLFLGSFLIGALRIAEWNTVLLVLTTVVSLEAIYLSIFIQMTVNRHSEELEEVSEDVEGIQEDVEDIQEDIEEITEDVEGIQEDVEEMSEEDAVEEEQTKTQFITLERLTVDLERVLKDLETFKKQ
jgi:biopolymer transport protein ExbB/TolQ